MAYSLLIIEDEALLLKELKRYFTRQGWRHVIPVKDLAGARAVLFADGLAPLVVLADMSLPDGNALDLLAEAREKAVGGEWIFLTGYGTVADSVRALQLGAYDFIEKPADFKRLDLLVAGAARSARAQRQLRDQQVSVSGRYTPEGFVGSSPAARGVREMLIRLARAPFSALVISGETGTGKGVSARIIHHNGPRAQGPLVELNCAALPKELQESELFGHEAGAFTGAKGRRRGVIEQADGGTLFLDEIGEMAPDLQTKLLKAIEDQRVRRLGGERDIEVDVQIIAATNRDLGEAVREGRFRDDLYHRINVFSVHLPPLRERLEDLDELVPRFLWEFNAKAGKDVRDVPAAAWERLRDHHWPGNVRELRNVIERCVLLAEGRSFPMEWLQLGPAPGAPPAAASPPQPGAAGVSGDGQDAVTLPLDGSLTLDDMDRMIIEAALERHDYNIAAAARVLGSTRDTLRYRIKKHGISLPEEH